MSTGSKKSVSSRPGAMPLGRSWPRCASRATSAKVTVPASRSEGGEIHAHPPPEDGVDHLVLDLLADVCGRRYYPQSVRGAEDAVLEGEVRGAPLELVGGDF